MFSEIPVMLRLCYWAVTSSRKANCIALLCTQQLQSLSSLETGSNSVSITSADVIQLKLWKRIRKHDPLINEILKLPETQSRISVLSELMECNESVVRELVRRKSNLLTSHSLLKKLKLLKDHGFSAEDIVAQPSVLGRSLLVLKNRLQIIENLQHPSAVSLHAINETDEVFEQIIQKCRDNENVMKNYSSHEQFLASLLQCDENSVARLAATNKRLMSISPALISPKISTLLKHNISHDYIRENLSILFHTSIRELDRRLTMLDEKLLIPIRGSVTLSFLLTCRREDFSLSFNYLCKQKDALEGCRDKLDYLCFRLQCDEASAKYFVTSPLIKKMSESKLKQILDFLLQEVKLEPTFILKNRLLFKYSIKRLQKRWIVLCNAGYRDVTMLPSAAILTNKQFSAKFGSCIFIDTCTSHEE